MTHQFLPLKTRPFGRETLLRIAILNNNYGIAVTAGRTMRRPDNIA